MSFLHKNDILKEYRRQHREEVAAKQLAENVAAADGDPGRTNENHVDEFPDVTAFQVVGSSSASPSFVYRSPQASMMSTMVEGNSATMTTTTSGYSQSREEHGRAGDANGKPRPSLLTIQTPFHDEAGAAGATGGKQNGVAGQSSQKSATSSQGTSAVKSNASTQENKKAGNIDSGHDADEFVDLDHYSPPLASPSANSRYGARPAPSSSHPQVAPALRTRSDISSEEDRVAKDSHLYSPATEPTVSATTLTAGAETFLSATDAADAAYATHKSSLRPAVDAAELGTPNKHAKTNSGSAGWVIKSTSGQSLSPSSSKLQSPTFFPAAPPTVPMSLKSAAQAAQVRIRSSGEDANRRQTHLDVSSSSSEDAVPNEANRKRRHAGDQPSMMSEEAVEKLCLNTTNSLDGETLMTGGSPGLARVEVSDTMLQPSTSILSEPSTIEVNTATLASLRNRAQALKAAERQNSARKMQQARGGGAATRMLLPHDLTATTNAYNAGDGEDDVYSRLSVTEVMDSSATPVNGDPSLVDTRVALGPSHGLSFSGTIHTLPRIGDDEDIDVDPSSTFTDSTGRAQTLLQPITFYEAYVELIKVMKRGGTAKDSVYDDKSASPKLSPPPPAAGKEKLGKKKTSLFASMFTCCGANESDLKARQIPSYTRTVTDLDRVRADSIQTSASAALTASPAAVGEGGDLQVVQFLKSCQLSLQNSTHCRILATVFNILTGQAPWPHLREKVGAPVNRTTLSSLRSIQWESIGFQGSNPATDVRATGVLGALQLLYLVDYYPVFAKQLWNLCRNPSGVKLSTGADAASSLPRAAGRVSNELPFVLVCFNFTALVLDAAGQQLLDAEIDKTKRTGVASGVPVAGSNKPEAHLATSPGMFVCCEAFIGALALFVDTWPARQQAEGRVSVSSSLPPLNRPSIAAFGDVKAKLRAQVLKPNGAALMQDAARKARRMTEMGTV